MSRLRTGLVRGAIAAAIVLPLLFVWNNRERVSPMDSGTRAPEYAAVTLDGDSVSLASLRGRVVLLNVWATWCGPCIREMPALERLHRMLEPEGLSIVAVSVDGASSGPGGGDVRAYVEDLGITFTVLHDPAGEIEEKFRVSGLPVTFVIDREGRVRERIVGAREWDEPGITSEIRKLLGG